MLLSCLLVLILFRHYDVISAPRDGWNTDPFTVTGRNGYLYGRGVTDNKGPIMAAACAAAELLRKRALGVDLVFLIEGEEEVGSAGFMDAVSAHKVRLYLFALSTCSHIFSLKSETSTLFCSGIIPLQTDRPFLIHSCSNSTWITEYPPCITYGLRGVVHATVEVCSQVSAQVRSGRLVDC